MTLDKQFQHGFALHQAGRLPEAREVFGQILRTDPRHFDALHALALVAFQMGDATEAAEKLEQALAIDGTVAPAYFNHGLILNALQRWDDAVASFSRAIALDSHAAQAYLNRGRAFSALGRYDEAVADLDHAITLLPQNADLTNDRGVVLQLAGHHDAALASFDRALAIDPVNVTALVNKSTVLISLARFTEALEAADRAIALQPTYGKAHGNRATVLDRLNQPEEAIDGYGKALACDPNIHLLAGRRLHALLRICRWDNIDNEMASLLSRVDQGHLATDPFYLLATPATRVQRYQNAALYCQAKVFAAATPPLARKQRGLKLRVGYFSADFHNHPTSYLAAGLMEAHNRKDFEIVGFTFRPVADEMTARLKAAFDTFIDVSAKTDHDVTMLAREMNIDIAVDLMGHTLDSRPAIFAGRAAPIQAAYLGFPGTTGLAAMDYVIADSIVIPRDHYAHYSEKVAALPDCYQVNDGGRSFTAQTSREDLGLPQDAFVFCDFNSSYKITPQAFDVWMRLLMKVENSVLWLLDGPASAVANLRRKAARRGIAPERLVFAPWAPMAAHLARHAAADLFLDTLHYNAHTTASDALWMGVPVVTLMGDTFPNRVAASLLTAVGLPQLITRTLEDYEALALDLALHREKLTALKRHLHDTRMTSALFDTARFASNIEAAYRKMWDIYNKTGGPQHFAV